MANLAMPHERTRKMGVKDTRKKVKTFWSRVNVYRKLCDDEFDFSMIHFDSLCDSSRVKEIVSQSLFQFCTLFFRYLKSHHHHRRFSLLSFFSYRYNNKRIWAWIYLTQFKSSERVFRCYQDRLPLLSSFGLLCVRARFIGAYFSQ